MVLAPEEKVALDAFCGLVRGCFGARVAGIALFGSRARGDVHEHSDIDVSVVVDAITWLEARQIDQMTADIAERHDVVLSPFVLSTERMTELLRRERAIAEEIVRDGIPL